VRLGCQRRLCCLGAHLGNLRPHPCLLGRYLSPPLAPARFAHHGFCGIGAHLGVRARCIDGD